MQSFSALLDRLALTPGRNAKITLMTDYFAATPDPDRGYALAAITRDLSFSAIKPAALRQLIGERMDPHLFELSYDYVGDLAETIALAWPTRHGANHIPSLREVVETLQAIKKTQAPDQVRDWLDTLDAQGRWALLKLVTGGLRIGVSARLAKTALARFGDKPVNEIEEIWHGLILPYTDLFAWLEGKADKPENTHKTPFRPVMLAHPIDEDKDFGNLLAGDFVAEWKWDGIRIQASARDGEAQLYSRTGDDIGHTFPDIIRTLTFDATIDGELLVFDPQAERFTPAAFGDLQQRLNRKTVSKAHLENHPAFIRAYDILTLGEEDLRPRPFLERRAILEDLLSRTHPDRMDLSPILAFDGWDMLAQLRASPPHPSIEGVMIKRATAPYVPGRPKGEWFKWKRDPFLVDAVMMYAQRGHGKRSSFYSDFTFGVWRDGEIVPVGKAYFGFTDEELKGLDKFVRNNTTDRFGPVRQVAFGPDKGLVLEIAFEGLNASTRHKSGVAMRFPRIHRIRWDKPAAEADTLESLKQRL
ncbi:MAG: cisplatin damage response ATP-dependent DNA ligase [Pseudomonadota bacterium]